jgi:hypothetical protein
MLQLLRANTPFDRTEGFGGLFGPSQKEVQLTAQLTEASQLIVAANAEIEKLRGEISEKENNVDTLRTLHAQAMEALRGEIATLQGTPLPLISDKCGWAKTHEVIDFVIISPDKKSAYVFGMQDKVCVFNDATSSSNWKPKPKDRLSCRVHVECAIECRSVAHMLDQYGMKIRDKLLNFAWQEITEPGDAQVQNVIVLQDIALGNERAVESRRELLAQREQTAKEKADADAHHGHKGGGDY